MIYNGKGVACDECRLDIDGILWHCDKADAHIHGYDICNSCIISFDPTNPHNQPVSVCDLSGCQCLIRIRDSLKQYHRFIDNQRITIDEHHGISQMMKQQCVQNKNKYDAKKHVNDVIKMDNVSFLNDFHHLLFIHKDEFEDIYNILIEYVYDNNVCNAVNCLMLRRNNRDRRLFCDNDDNLNRIYLNQNEYNINQQQYLDKIHCCYLHSFDIGYKITRREMRTINTIIESDNKEDSNNIGSETSDQITSHIIKLNKHKQQSFPNIDELGRLNSSNNNENSKYLTNIDLKENRIYYSHGIRYFYWEYYKNNTNEVDDCVSVGGCGMSLFSGRATNEGYTLQEWYIHPKFANLKIELTQNSTCVIGVNQWDRLLQQANDHAKSKLYKSMKCVHQNHEAYGLQLNSIITPRHLVAMMIYCNQDVLQRKFTETFRRIPSNETKDSLIKRHRIYAQFGRLLRECVECFGCQTVSVGYNAKDIIKFPHFYHGINTEAQFDSLGVSFKGPTSTSTELGVAVEFASKNGLILDFVWDFYWKIINKNNYERYAMFDCQFLSNYPNECEMFFIGGFVTFGIQNIILVSSDEKLDFYVAALNMICNTITEAEMSYFAGIYSMDMNLGELKQFCFRILSHETYLYYPNSKNCHKFAKMPLYIEGLVHSHFRNMQKLFFFGANDVEDNNYIIKIIKSLFFYDYGWINLETLMTVFPSLKHIGFNIEENNPSFFENALIYESIYEYLTQNNNTTLKLIELCIANKEEMSSNLQKIIAQFNHKFNKYKWKIDIDEYKGDATAKINIVLNGYQVPLTYR